MNQSTSSIADLLRDAGLPVAGLDFAGPDDDDDDDDDEEDEDDDAAVMLLCEANTRGVTMAATAGAGVESSFLTPLISLTTSGSTLAINLGKTKLRPPITTTIKIIGCAKMLRMLNFGGST